MPEGYRLWVNDDRTVMLRMWPDGQVEVCLRDDAGHTWGPPIMLTEEA
jgi:hypothetical protein